MAENDVETMIAMLVKKFQFLPGSIEPKPFISVTLASFNGVHIKVVKR